MTTTEATKPGTASSPKLDEPIKWVTPEEVERFEKMLAKPYVRKDAKTGKPVEDSSKYFYRIIGMHPRFPAVKTLDAPMGNTEQFLITFEVQKYYRHEYKETNSRDSVDGAIRQQKVNKPVDKWEMGKNGQWNVVCDDGNFFKDARDFCIEFMPDQINE